MFYLFVGGKIYMLEVLFWIFVSFFSAVGVVQTIYFLKSLNFKSNFSPPVVLILQDNAACAETQVRYILSQLRIQSRVILVDMGVCEEDKKILQRIEQNFPISIVSKTEIQKILSPV